MLCVGWHLISEFTYFFDTNLKERSINHRLYFFHLGIYPTGLGITIYNVKNKHHYTVTQNTKALFWA